MLEASRERLGKSPLANLGLRSLDRVRDPPKARPPGVEVENEVRGTRVSVSRLSDGAGVEEPALGGVEVELRVAGGEAAVDRPALEREGEGEVTVADEDDPVGGGGERGRGRVGRKHVLPDRISRARVVEADGLARRRRRERSQVRARVLVEDGGGPARAHGGVARELVEAEHSEHAEIVVSDQRDVRPFGDEAATAVRARPVPYEVPEAPDLVRCLPVEGSEDRFERMQVSVNVRNDAGAHGRRATVAKLVGALALAAVWGVSAYLLLRTRVPHLDLPAVEAREYFPPADLERIEGFRAVTRSLWAGSLALELVVLGVIVWKARPLAALVARLARGRVRTGVAIGLVAVLAVWLVRLPLGAVSHWWDRRHGLSRQGYDAWLGDQAIGLGLQAVLVAIAVAGAVFLAARLGRRWWVAGAPALVGVAAVFVLAQPLVVQPLFNRFEPLPDRRLRAEIERLGGRIGVDVDTVQVADASRRTTTANAYVAGIGPTRRVVFYDTILAGRFSDRELVSVSAHELAHVARRHLWKGLAWFALLAVPGVFLVARVTERRGGLGDPALVPLALLVALLVALATLPLQNWVSRRYEAEADWLALTATRDPDSAIALDRRLVLTSLGDPDPPAWARLLLSTHPSALERIAMAEAFREGARR